MEKAAGEVRYAQRFYTGNDGKVYTRLRPNDLLEDMFGKELVVAVNDDLQLVTFSPTERVTTLD